MRSKHVAAFLAAALALSFTGCGKDDNKKSMPAASLSDKTSAAAPSFGEDENAAENADVSAGNAAASAAMSETDGGSSAAADGESGVTVGGFAGQYTVAEGEEPWWCRGDMYIERRGNAYQVAFGDMQRFAGYPSEDVISQQTPVTEFRGDGEGEVIGTVALFRSGIKIRVEFRSYDYEDNKDDDPSNDKVSECVFIKIADL